MTAWRKASACGASNTCVEVASWRAACSNEGNCVEAGRVLGGGAVAVRDSADPGGPVLVLAPGAWAGLLSAVKEDR